MIFATLCSPQVLETIHASECRYTGQSGCVTVGGMDDGEEFGATVKSLAGVRVGPTDQGRLLRTAAGILLLGNVDFEDETCGDRSMVCPGTGGIQHLERAATLLGLGGEAGEGAESLGAALVTQVKKREANEPGDAPVGHRASACRVG